LKKIVFFCYSACELIDSDGSILKTIAKVFASNSVLIQST